MILSVIGSAGRKQDEYLVTKTRFDNMCLQVENMILTAGYKFCDLILQSGGAAFADHVVVVLGLKHKCRVRLHLPCAWTGNGFVDTGSSHPYANPGRTSNHYHTQFSRVLGYNTLDQIEQLRLQGAEFYVYKGFKQRNLQVAKSDMLIAFTSSNDSTPRTDGGTYHTWCACSNFKCHISLHIIQG